MQRVAGHVRVTSPASQYVIHTAQAIRKPTVFPFPNNNVSNTWQNYRVGTSPFLMNVLLRLYFRSKGVFTVPLKKETMSKTVRLIK